MTCGEQRASGTLFGGGCLSPQMLESSQGLQCLADLAAAEARLISEGVVRGYNAVLVACPRRPKPQPQS